MNRVKLLSKPRATMNRDGFFRKIPDSIKVSITNICNYKCIMCYISTLTDQKGTIDDNLFYDIVDQSWENGIEKLSIGAVGEPLIHRNFIPFLEYAKSKDLWVSTTSNCSLLTKEISRALIESKLDRFNISIYSSSTAEHEKYTGSKSFERVVENVTYFLEQWASSGKRIEINLWFLPLPGVNSLRSYFDFWGPLIDKVGLKMSKKEVINWGGKVGLGGSRKFRWGSEEGKKYLAWHRKTICNHVKNYLHILHNGDILPCCVIPEVGEHPEIHFGNAVSDRLMDVWVSEKYLKFKNDVFNKKYAIYTPCSKCSRIFQEKKVWLSLENIPERFRQLFN